MKTNVLFDFNMILNSYFDETYKTGIFWVQYNILLEMVKKHEKEINFFAWCNCSEKFFNTNVLKKYPEFKIFKYKNIFSKSGYYKNLLKTKISVLRKTEKTTNSKIKKITIKIKTLSLKFIKLFTKFLSKKEQDISKIHCYQSFFYEIPKVILQNTKIKKFIIIHDLLPLTNPEYFEKEKNIQNMVKNFRNRFNFGGTNTTAFVVSSYVKNEIKKYLPEINNNKIILNTLAANDNYYKLKKTSSHNKILKKYGIPINSKYILSLSSLNKRKNLAFLVDGFIELLESNPEINDLYLVLAGPKGWMMENLFESINNAKKYKDKIILTGFVDEKDINIVYNNALMFVFPSLAEGFGLPILEAMQCGIPVISSNSTSLPEVYGDAALNINHDDKKNLIKAIKDLYNDENLRKEMSQKGLKQAKKFNWEKTVNKMVKEYGENKKILILYNTPLTENKSGTQNRIINVMEYLKKNGYSMDQFIFGKSETNIKTSNLIDNLYFYEYNKIPFIKKILIQLKTHNKFTDEEKKIKNILKQKYYKTEFLKEKFKKIIDVETYDFVIAVNAENYLYTECFGKNTKKILFMEDVMFNQFKDRNPKKIVEKYIQLYKKFEKNIVNNFDNIVGISPAEIDIFKNNDNKHKFIYLPPIMQPKNIQKKSSYKYDIIYVASDNPHNVKAFKWFLNKVYPNLKDIKILCIGAICNKVENHNKYNNIKFIDFINNLENAYNDAKIAICPMFTGTGVKIKTIEAMSYGKPIVANEMGMIGLPSIKNRGCLVTDDPIKFAEYIKDLLTNEELFNKCSKQALEYFNKYFSYNKNIKKLDKIFK